MTLYRNILAGFLFITAVLCGCGKKFLDVEPFSQYSSSFLQTVEGVETVMNSAYKGINFISDARANRIYAEESSSDVLINFRGLLNGNLQPIMDFTWTTSHPFFEDQWRINYQGIRDANILLETIPAHPLLSDEQKQQLAAEMHFVRGVAYFNMYLWYGALPLKTSSESEDLFVARATDEQTRELIEADLLAAEAGLAVNPPAYGRASKGAATGFLAQFYLQTKQWGKASQAAQRVIDMKKYALWPDVRTLFAIANEKNSEMIYVAPCIAVQNFGSVWIANAMPPGYPVTIQNTATQVCVPVAFYNSFAAGDQRRDLLLASYTNQNGQVINLTTGNEYQNPRSFKYPVDPNQQERHGGADMPIIRYAEILLIKAEAVVMDNNDITEGLRLLNLVRTRAGLSAYQIENVPSKEVFIDLLLAERKFEFFSEGKRRLDLLRHDRFITAAVARGKNARAHHNLFPIPQSEIDAYPNQALAQNPGY